MLLILKAVPVRVIPVDAVYVVFVSVDAIVKLGYVPVIVTFDP